MNELPQKLVKQKDFAVLAGVTPQVVNYNKKNLGGAVVGRKIDVNHPLAQSFIQANIINHVDVLNAPGEKIGVGGENVRQSVGQLSIELKKSENQPVLPEQLESLTLKEIIKYYGSMPGFQAFLAAHDKLTGLKTKQIKQDAVRRVLIDKQYEGKLAFEAIELLFKRLTADVPDNLTLKVISLAEEKKQASALAIKREIITAISNVLRTCQNTLIKKLEADKDEVLKKLYVKIHVDDFEEPEERIWF